MAVRKKSSMAKQEKAQARRGGMQPSGRAWYTKALPDNERTWSTFKRGTQPKGWVRASKPDAKSFAQISTYDAWYSGLPGAVRGRKIAAQRAAAPKPRVAKKQAERKEPKRTINRLKKK